MSELPTRLPACVYRVDRHDFLTHVNAEWDRFAMANGGAPMSDRVLGTRIWDAVNDPHTVHIYRHLVRKAREGGDAIRFPFRCDSPQRRRFMEMTIRPCEGGAVEFVSSILHEERREIRVNGRIEPRDGAMIRMCSWCKKVAAPDGSWLEMEEAVSAMRFLEAVLPPAITHTICGECWDVMRKQIDGLKPHVGPSVG